MSPIVKYGGSFVVFCFAIAILASLTGNQKTEPVTPIVAETPAPVEVRPPPAPVELPIAVKATTLLADYKANEVAADQRWKGKRVRVVGTIQSIEKMFGEPIVALGSRWDHVRCWFPKDTTAPLEKISKGGSIMLDGRCDGAGVAGDVVVRDCSWPPSDQVQAETPEAIKWWKGH